MTIDLKAIFHPSLITPIPADDFKKGMIVITPISLVSFYYLPALLILLTLLAIISSRRLADLLGVEFYSQTRALGAWIALAGLFSIPFIGIPLVLWVLCVWDRHRVREFLRSFFEAAELI